MPLSCPSILIISMVLQYTFRLSSRLTVGLTFILCVLYLFSTYPFPEVPVSPLRLRLRVSSVQSHQYSVRLRFLRYSVLVHVLRYRSIPFIRADTQSNGSTSRATGFRP